MPSGPTARVVGLSVALAATATVLTSPLAGRGSPSSAPTLLAVAALVAAFALADAMSVYLEVHGEAFAFSLSEIPLIVGLATVAPAYVVVAHAAGMGIALVVRRRPALKIAFNVAQTAAVTAASAVLYVVLLDGASPSSARAWPVSLIVGGVHALLSSLAVLAVISIVSGRPSERVLSATRVATVVAGVAAAALGMLAVATWAIEPWLVVPLAVAVGALYLLERLYARLGQQYESLEAVYDFTTLVSSSLELRVVAGHLLSAARAMLRCSRAELVVVRGESELLRFVATSDGDELHESNVPLHRAAAELAGLGPPDAPHVLHLADLPPWLGPFAKDAAFAPVRFGDALLGALVVGDRLAATSTLDAGDARMLSTLASQASAAIQNSRLYTQLGREAALRTHQAMHDALTGLPNRVLLDEHVSALIGDRLASALDNNHAPVPIAVLLFDLDGFKEVNDTLGHGAGDELLRSMCERVRAILPSDAMFARFGGDEFVVVLDGDEAVGGAEQVGHLVLRTLSHPFVALGLSVALDASVGIARFPDHGSTCADLLQRADVAMYGAKGSMSRVRTYVAADDPFTPQRLALSGELRASLDGRRSDLRLDYQPIIDVATGSLVAVEALVRWMHPERGLLAPIEFVGVAERTGLIQPLSRWVLTTALRQQRSWREAGLNISVAVNLSMQNLLDARLADDIAELLEQTGVPPSSLIVELTESAAIAEGRKSHEMLLALRQIGVHLSVDDFGTGYSALSYLHELPVTELKIDRSFVDRVNGGGRHAAIVRTIIALAHQLNLSVVAEGVENVEQLRELAALHCDLAQGFAIARPMPASALATWQRDWTPLLGREEQEAPERVGAVDTRRAG